VTGSEHVFSSHCHAIGQKNEKGGGRNILKYEVTMADVRLTCEEVGLPVTVKELEPYSNSLQNV
jgi:hypothetical protein